MRPRRSRRPRRRTIRFCGPAAEYKGPSAKQAEAEHYEAAIKLAAQSKEVAFLREQLAAAEKAESDAQHTTLLNFSRLTAAVDHESTLSQWQQQVDAAAAIEEISPEQIAEAQLEVDAARSADRLGHAVREARLKIADAEQAEAESKRLSRISPSQLRAAAKGTDEVLSEAVAKLGTPLKVVDGRLVLKTGRGDTYFGELSTGERWKLALDIAIDAVGVGGALAVSQEAWEGLDPANRRLIAEHVKGRGVLLITAEACDGELRAEEFSTNHEDASSSGARSL